MTGCPPESCRKGLAGRAAAPRTHLPSRHGACSQAGKRGVEVRRREWRGGGKGRSCNNSYVVPVEMEEGV